MPTLRIQNVSGATATLPADAVGGHLAGLPVGGSYTDDQVKSGLVNDELIEEFMDEMDAGISGGDWLVTQTAADWGCLERSEHIEAGPFADTDPIVIAAPARLVGLGYTPLLMKFYTVGAGAVGARTATLLTEYSEITTGITLVSYNEATGDLTLTNNTGGGVSDLHVQILWGRVTQ